MLIRLYMYIRALLTLPRHENAQGLAEYAMILLFVAVALVVTISALGAILQTAYYDRLANELF